MNIKDIVDKHALEHEYYVYMRRTREMYVARGNIEKVNSKMINRFTLISVILSMNYSSRNKQNQTECMELFNCSKT